MAVDKRQLAIQIIKTATEMGASSNELCDSFHEVLSILKETKKDLPLSVTHENVAAWARCPSTYGIWKKRKEENHVEAKV